MTTAVILSKEDLQSALVEIINQEFHKTALNEHLSLTRLRAVMTVAQLGEDLQVTQQSIFNWIRRPKGDNPLPVRYVGNDPRFYLDEINEWTHIETVRKSLKKK